MEIILAEKAGFCFGVQRALNIAQQAARDHARVYTLGSLIHNRRVVEELREQGIEPVDDLNRLAAGDVLVIRSHGVSPAILEQARERGIKLVDATCPFVRQAQELAHAMYREGYQVVVVGDPNHPEVAGIVGWTNGTALVVENAKAAEKLPPMAKVAVVAQTTQPRDNFLRVVEVLKGKAGELKSFDTICHATRERQEAAARLARQVDVMIVVGGKESANTGKLARLCKETGTPTYHIEGAAELKPEWFAGARKVGVTAGASTPRTIIEEVIKAMEEIGRRQEEQEKNLLEKALEFREVKPGEIIKGIVVKVFDDEVLVDVGGKTEGVIPLRECSCCHLTSPRNYIREGEVLDLYVIKTEDAEGRMILSKRRADAIKAWDILRVAYEKKEPVEGLVTDVVKGGLLLDLGVAAFMPASHVAKERVEDLRQFIGQRLKGFILELDPRRNKVVVSRRAWLEEEEKRRREELLRTLQEGEVRRGVVRRITDFGAFVDIGGIDGLLHVKDMAWYRVENPADVVREGQEIDVLVLNVNREEGKVALGLKQLYPNPWSQVAEKYPVGSVVRGKVVRLAPFGAFVELEPGVDGLVHISQLSDRRVVKPEEVVTPGQEVLVKVIGVNGRDKKISLSMREVEQETPEGGEIYLEKKEEAPATIGDVCPELREIAEGKEKQ